MNIQQQLESLQIEYQVVLQEGLDPDCQLSLHDANKIRQEIKSDINQLVKKALGGNESYLKRTINH